MSVLLRTNELSAGYHGVPVVRGVSITVNPGEVVALLGPNGAGKTTTLLAVSALLPALAGSIDLLGADITRQRTRPHRLVARGLAHVPEDRSLFFELTVREHLRICRAATPDATDRALSHFPALQPLMDRKAGLLSGGEQQMLALARGFATQPRLLLVDELSLGLAPVIVERIFRAVRALASQTGAGVLLVEQHAELALRTADRAYVMVNGRVVTEGRAGELRKRRDLLTASYLGEQAARSENATHRLRAHDERMDDAGCTDTP